MTPWDVDIIVKHTKVTQTTTSIACATTFAEQRLVDLREIALAAARERWVRHGAGSMRRSDRRTRG
jgi:hypothetical protein